jgi:hypothetical protein
MEKKRNFLEKRANKLTEEAKAAKRNGQQQTMNTKVLELDDVMRQIETIDNVLANSRTTRSAMDQAAVNVNAFTVQKDAVTALEDVNNQVTAGDIDDVSSRLEIQLDEVDDVSRVMAKPLRRRGRGKPSTQRQDRINDIVASWDTAELPSVKTGTPSQEETGEAVKNNIGEKETNKF